MSRKQLMICGSALVSAAVIAQFCGGNLRLQESLTVFAVAAEDKTSKGAERPDAKPANEADGKLKIGVSATHENQKSADAAKSSDEDAIVQSAISFVNAYNKADAKAIAEQFTPDAEYIDEQGYGFQGREAIEDAFTACFAAHPGAEIEMSILTLRTVSPGVVIEDGVTIVKFKHSTSGPLETVYNAVHVKTDGKWLTASVREQAPKGRRQHRAQLEQLSWMMGDWVDEGEDTLVMSSCKAIQGGNFLLREFKIHIAGEETIRGEQRIGWDPLTGKLKSWVFDSDGGYSEGYWHRDDNRWILKSVGVSMDGQPASSTTIYTLLDEDRMTWQTVDHEAAGVRFPDSDVVTIVRRAPPPKVEEEKLSTQRQ